MDVTVLPDQPILRVRLRKGLVGESCRTVHLVPVPDHVPDELTAFCGETFAPGSIDLLSGFNGMPCFACLNQLGLSEHFALVPGIWPVVVFTVQLPQQFSGKVLDQVFEQRDVALYPVEPRRKITLLIVCHSPRIPVCPVALPAKTIVHMTYFQRNDLRMT
ncbi:hypothetical protein [Sciscionella marina]|uniref:hypothetical protein n=1 Tax=Sciscionella marina TaxID=508770 RepID=UPI0012F6F442|nr:hypothetical protein [Sciscionella marina]